MVRHRRWCALVGAVAGLVGCANDATVGGPRADVALVSSAGNAAVATAGGSYTLIAKVPVPRPFDIAVNARTDRIYVISHDFFSADPAQTGRVVVIAGTTSQVIASIPVGQSPTAIAVDPILNRAYVSLYQGELVVIDGATNTVIQRMPAGPNFRYMGLDPASDRVYGVRDAIESLDVFRASDGSAIAGIPVPSRPGPLAINASTNRLYVAGGASWLDELVVLDPFTGSLVAHLHLDFGLWSIAANAITNRVYVGTTATSSTGYDPAIFVIDGSTNTVAARIPVALVPADLAVDEVLDRVYVMESDAGTLAVIDGATNAVLTRLSLVTWARHLDVNPQTHRVYVSDDFGSQVWIYEWAADPVGMEAISALIQALVAGGSLDDRDATGLLSKLDAAASLAADGKPAPAQALLNAFLKQINALVASGRLSDAQAQPLRDAALQEIASLGG